LDVSYSGELIGTESVGGCGRRLGKLLFQRLLGFQDGRRDRTQDVGGLADRGRLDGALCASGRRLVVVTCMWINDSAITIRWWLIALGSWAASAGYAAIGWWFEAF